ncbi:MAG TPA: DUF1249 domain-containing protein [Pinirhizobacter sp.]|uniref:DUF1249 domain-containing protein n=1 Tax=Pinirhizobacter sp. TaxID=2950432 RepID=UPI002CAF08E5|nr:DUF1249 domain-containing protein [Pinirhizobacter sp.]HMH67607.1 DUF1249 domain-containing protein [Pinirhizobacter sp.]
MSAVLDRPESLLPGRFEYLMGLYAENYHRLVRLFAPHKLAAGEYVSSVDDGLDVRLKIQEKHPYTVELELTYAFVDAETGQPSPSAQLRMYTDAHVAEALHCHPGRRLWQVLGPFPPAHTVLQHRLTMNGFLTRWLEYLAEQGHSIGTLERVADEDAEA